MYYQDFAPMFTAKLWEPERWAELIVDSGAKYTVLTSKHHEGFCLWPSKPSWNWNADDIGAKRDIVGQLAKAVRAKNVTFGLYYSLYGTRSLWLPFDIV
jgi:alpha-L-fucosidase